MDTATYEVELRIDGTLIGDVRRIAQDLVWARRRTRAGVDSIDFTINDVLFQQWCVERGTDINNMLRPLALECRIIRNGVPVMGGFLATMPGYAPQGTSANLALRFDGYLNYLAGVYIAPIGTVTGAMGQVIVNQITDADNRARSAGKAFGFSRGVVSPMDSIMQTFDNYVSVKEFIVNRCDNVTGAGPFDVFFHPDRTYDIKKDSEFGDVIGDYSIYYPTRLNNVSATSISADEVEEYASTVIGIGSGEISSDPDKNTAVTDIQTNSAAVTKYGYSETILQDSSVTQKTSLQRNVSAELARISDPLWQPQIVLTGRQVNPTPNGEKKLWIGDTVALVNEEDLTGQTSGLFRVNELAVSVTATGAEIITPVLERV